MRDGDAFKAALRRAAITIFAVCSALAPAGCNLAEDYAAQNAVQSSDRACTYTVGGPRPFPIAPAGANEDLISKGGQTLAVHDSFEPVWGRVCLQNGRDSMLAVTATLPDQSAVTVNILQNACADFHATRASVRGRCVNEQDSTCPIYTYTMLRRCAGTPRPEVVEKSPHSSHVQHRFDVNPSAYEFMRRAVPVRVSVVRPTVFLVSANLATIEICRRDGNATLTAYADTAGTGTQIRTYVLRNQPACFAVQGRNLSARLNAPYPPHTVPPQTVLTYRLLSVRP